MSKTQQKSQAIYDIDKSYQQNVDEGPQFSGDFPTRKWAARSEWIDFLGYRIASPTGVPAGPLLTAEWVDFAAKLGYDVLTYKTIRSYPSPAHALPNVLFVDQKEQFKKSDIGGVVHPADSDKGPLAITNSFGNPSQEPTFLQQDLVRARESLSPGQVLIVSVFGTGDTLEELINSYVRAACLARDANAHIIEANFSCPNVKSGGALFADAETAFAIAKAITKAIGSTPLVIKVGLYPDFASQQKAYHAFARAGAQAVCGLNTIPMQVQNLDGTPPLGTHRLTSGICGAPIRELALEFIRESHKIIKTDSLPLELIGCGGIVEPEHFDQFLEAGAKVAMTATGMMWDPLLATRWGEKHGSH